MKKTVIIFFIAISFGTSYGQQDCSHEDRINTAISYLARNQVKEVYYWQSCYGDKVQKTRLFVNSYSIENCGNNLYAIRIAGSLNGKSVAGRVNVNDLYIPNGRFAISLGTLNGVQTSPCVPSIDLQGTQSQYRVQNPPPIQSAPNTESRSTPVLRLTVSSLNFGEVKIGNIVSRNFSIQNSGNATLTLIGIRYNNKAISYSQIPATVAAGSSVQVTLYFQPESAGQLSDNFIISSNGGISTVSLNGQGITEIPFRPENTYPKKNSNALPNFNHYAYSDKANPYVASGNGGQCTAYAFGRVLEVTGKRMDCLGNAKEWIQCTKYPKGSIPKPNSLAIWEGIPTNNTYKYGHVAFVESVSANGDVIISEANIKNYNEGYGGGYDETRIFSTEEMKDRTKPGTGKVGKLVGYIYF